MLLLLLCAGAVSSAPQDSDVTFVKIQPLLSAERASGESGELVRRARQDDVTAALDDEDTEAPEPAEVAPPRERITSPRTGVPERISSLRTTTARSFARPRPTQPSPRFISKLSYFEDDGFSSGVSNNLVEKFGKDARKFQTSCRCEKIWNCPKLQITVPRCPNEYFLCCD
ncbi:jg18561 [Pararge aegeria aegeria]|uniref:Jg18561 protein n=2 Tax=Pararge aegeria TaxID=116150 RepID=A0A8S4QM01_9NEOP|nr:jg18561 [Pararge aegeria aegeria]